MFKHKKTGIKFDNRKQAVILMGQSRYRRFLKDREFEFEQETDKTDKPN